jgi:glucosamine-6-phosphate deaminase
MEKKVNGIVFKTVAKEWDVYFDMAMAMLEEIMKNNEQGKKTVMIVPVGPTDQYPILAKLVNQLKVSLKNVWFFNMDEYMYSPTEMIDPNHFMSFEKRMNDEFYSRVDEALVMPKEQRLFPRVGKEKEYDELIEKLGGVDACFGGLGINGHVAFNEPAEEDDPITAEEFANLPTRVLPISRETKTINAYGYQRGDLRGMPQWCITVGMKQIVSARKIYIALNREWQHGIVKHVLFDKPQAQIPASLMQGHENVVFCAYENVAKNLF